MPDEPVAIEVPEMVPVSAEMREALSADWSPPVQVRIEDRGQGPELMMRYPLKEDIK